MTRSEEHEKELKLRGNYGTEGPMYLLIANGGGKSIELYEESRSGSSYSYRGDETHWQTPLINLLEHDVTWQKKDGWLDVDRFTIGYKPFLPDTIDDRETYTRIIYKEPQRTGVRIHFNDGDSDFDSIRRFVDENVEEYMASEAYNDAAEVAWDKFGESINTGKTTLARLRKYFRGPFFTGCDKVFRGVKESSPDLIEDGMRTVRRDTKLPEDFIRGTIREINGYLEEARPLGIKPEVKLSVGLQPVRAQVNNLSQTAEQYKRSVDQGGYIPGDILNDFERMQSSVSSWAKRLKRSSPDSLVDEYDDIEEDLIKVKRATEYVRRRMGHLEE